MVNDLLSDELRSLGQYCIRSLAFVFIIIKASDSAGCFSKTNKLRNIYIFTAIALDEAVFLVALHLLMKTIKTPYDISRALWRSDINQYQCVLYDL